MRANNEHEKKKVQDMIALSRPLTDYIVRLAAGTLAIAVGLASGVALIWSLLDAPSTIERVMGFVFTFSLAGLVVGSGVWILRPALSSRPCIGISQTQLSLHFPLLLNQELTFDRTNIRSVAIRDQQDRWHVSRGFRIQDIRDLQYLRADETQIESGEHDAVVPFLTYSQASAPNVLIVFDQPVAMIRRAIRPHTRDLSDPRFWFSIKEAGHVSGLLLEVRDPAEAQASMVQTKISIGFDPMEPALAIPTESLVRRAYYLHVAVGVGVLVAWFVLQKLLTS